MKPYHKNPRQINEKQFTSLGKWLDELGDLSGIVHDLNSDEVIGGNQRGRVFDLFNGDCEIVIEHQFKKPDRQGTVALGYILWNGAKYQYRQVQWTPEQCEKANIVANKAGGGWDFDILANEFELPDLLEWGFEPFELGVINDNGGMSWGDAFNKLPGGERSPFQQMTFTLHDSQVEEVKRALTIAKGQGEFISHNENSNGNALTRICETYITEYGQS